VNGRNDSSLGNFAFKDESDSESGGLTYTSAHNRLSTRYGAVSRGDHSGRVQPSLLGLVVLHREVVSHHDQVSVSLGVLHLHSHDLTEGIETGGHFAVLVLHDLEFLLVIEES